MSRKTHLVVAGHSHRPRAEVVRGVFAREDCATRHEMRHYALGIVGLGQVGMRVARLARAFDMRSKRPSGAWTDVPDSLQVWLDGILAKLKAARDHRELPHLDCHDRKRARNIERAVYRRKMIAVVCVLDQPVETEQCRKPVAVERKAGCSEGGGAKGIAVNAVINLLESLRLPRERRRMALEILSSISSGWTLPSKTALARLSRAEISSSPSASRASFLGFPLRALCPIPRWLSMAAATNSLTMATGSEELKARALRHLARREHSRAELARKLAPHAESPAALGQLLDALAARRQLSDERYAEALANVEETTPLAELTKDLGRRQEWQGRPVRAINPLAPEDVALLEAIGHGEDTINGFRNRDIRQRLYEDDVLDRKRTLVKALEELSGKLALFTAPSSGPSREQVERSGIELIAETPRALILPLVRAQIVTSGPTPPAASRIGERVAGDRLGRPVVGLDGVGVALLRHVRAAQGVEDVEMEQAKAVAALIGPLAGTRQELAAVALGGR